MATQIRVVTQDGEMIVLLDLSEEQPITANYQFKDIQDLGKNKGNHTYNFRVPSTPNNNLFFGDYFEVTQQGNYNPKMKVQATINVDTIDVFNGYLQLTNVIVKNEETTSYECVVFSSLSTLGQVLDGKYLSDFDWSYYDHPISINNVLSSMDRDITPFKDGDIVYSMYDYGTGFHGGTMNSITEENQNTGEALRIESLKPQIRANKVFRKILEESGFTYTSDFIDVEMNNLYVDLNAGSEGVGTNIIWGYYSVWIGNDITQNFPCISGSSYTLQFAGQSNNSYTNIAGDFNEATGIYTPSGIWSSHNFRAYVEFSYPYQLGGSVVLVALVDLTT